MCLSPLAVLNLTDRVSVCQVVAGYRPVVLSELRQHVLLTECCVWEEEREEDVL